MSTQSADQLFKIIDDSTQSSQERTQAVKALGDLATPAIIDRLINLMSNDSDSSVRWAAASALNACARCKSFSGRFSNSANFSLAFLDFNSQDYDGSFVSLGRFEQKTE